jgi:hypothetical protein
MQAPCNGFLAGFHPAAPQAMTLLQPASGLPWDSEVPEVAGGAAVSGPLPLDGWL